MARGRINDIDLTDEDREALRWWMDAREGDEMPDEIELRLNVASFITRKRSDAEGEWLLTQKGVRAVRQLKKENDVRTRR